MKKINILSMGWRSHWLAKRLYSLGVEVDLYEVTDHAGWTHPEDIDGPFPFSINSGSPDEFVNILAREETLEKLNGGFCLSTKSGNLAWEAQNRDYVLENFKEDFYKEALEGQKFWFEDFLRAFGKSSFKKSSDWLESESKFSLESDLYVRKSNKSNYKESLEMLSKKGVQVHDVSQDELDKILAKVKEEPKEWIVALTVFELKLLTYNKVESLDTALGWHRKRFFYKENKLESLPKWTCWVDSAFKPWKEANLNIVVKGNDGELYLDVWTLEPIYKLGIKKEAGMRALKFLNKEFVHTNFMAQQSENLEGALKTLFPVSQEREPLNDTGYIWNSPIEWRGFTMDLMYTYQNNLAHKIYDKGAGQ